MIGFELSIDQDSFRQALRTAEMEEQRKIELLLEAVGAETVAFLRTLTAETRPGVRPGEPARRAHPGGWADITGNLANAYAYEVQRIPDGATLVLSNSMEYSAVLEIRDGYFVLRGVTDPGGPLEQALRRAIPQVAPGWTVL